MVNYGGDEVSALVLDIGSSSIRAGYAGDDTPKAIIPTSYGYTVTSNTDVTMAEPGEEDQVQKLANPYISQSGPSIWKEGMEVGTPMRDGLIYDFNPIPALVKHAFEDVMRCDPSEHPVIVTEPAWNTVANRERMAEIMFEEFQVPAFYIANTGVLNAFAAGKGSALVIDVGHTMASVTPVVDGFVLRKGLNYSPLPKLVRAHALHTLVSPAHNRRGIELWPHQLIANKMPVEINAPPRYALREDRLAGTTDTWRSWAQEREVDEWIQSVAGVTEQGWNDQLVAQKPVKQYEFPTGYNTNFGGIERLSVGELFFHHHQGLVHSNPQLPRHIPHLIGDALRACDAEIRQVLLSNIVLTGGGSLFAGFSDRLATELSRNHAHVKIHAPGNPTERRYGGWLGGSILASLGTFHQLWISKEEWQEHGKAIVGQRCK